MFKKTMQFDDLEGNPVTQTFYFNYTKKEVAELLEFKRLEEKLTLLTKPVEETGLTEQENTQQAYDIFQELILDAYGEKGADNVTFVKNERTREYFSSHVAFVELIFEFLENPQLANDFIEKCLPPRMVAEAKKQMQTDNAGKLDSGTLADMIDEAARRQQDPATRIEPGAEAARAALGDNPEVERLAQETAQQGPQIVSNPDPVVTAAKKPEDMTVEDIESMSAEDFAKWDPRGMPQDVVMAAFRRKLSG